MISPATHQYLVERLHVDLMRTGSAICWLH